MSLRVTERGLAMLREGEAIFDELREQWEKQVGAESLTAIEESLRILVGGKAIDLEAPGWAGPG